MEKTIKEWLDNFDSGKKVKTVSMGGLGKGYEEAIQSLAVEIMRSLPEERPDDDKKYEEIMRKARDGSADKLDKIFGFSGAQVGAATNIAAVYWKKGPDEAIKMMEKMDASRIFEIQQAVKYRCELIGLKGDE